MSPQQLDVYIPTLFLALFAALIFFGSIFLVSRILRPSNPNKIKETPYECGEEPIGSAWSNFNVRFYVVSLIFIIFDVEGALMFPVASVFRKFNEIGEGGVLLGSLLIFITVLLVGIVYCWKKGDFDWVKSFQLDPSQINLEKKGASRGHESHH